MATKFGSGLTGLVCYRENLRQDAQEILHKGGWGRAKRAPRNHALSTGGSLRSTPATHTFANFFGSGYAGLGIEKRKILGNPAPESEPVSRLGFIATR